jgi:hypothetical protein
LTQPIVDPPSWYSALIHSFLNVRPVSMYFVL